MADDYVKFDSMLMGDETDDEEQRVQQRSRRSKGSLASRIFNKGMNAGSNMVQGAMNVGTKALAGGMAAVQSVSVTSLAGILSVAIGLTSAGVGGEDFPIQYRDDVSQANEYSCLDEYSEAYAGMFGTLDEQPLPTYDNNVLLRLKEINEWSKTYVGQSVSDILVCDKADCAYYGHTGCTDPEHPLKQVANGTYTYVDSGGQIDLANIKRIHSFFSAYGLTDVQIAAICGVMTMETRVDFTAVEGYSISGDRYNIDPSVATSEFAWKTFAEGVGDSPVGTPTCIHELAANAYGGADNAVDYTAYMAEYPNIYKLGIGLIQFTDGPGFNLNTYLRNYADHLNDRVVLIQRMIEGAKGWRDELRQNAADKYTEAYGAIGSSVRGTPKNYIDPSTGYEYKDKLEIYIEKGKILEEKVNEYNAMSAAYIAAANALQGGSWEHHTVTWTPMTDVYDSSVYDIVFSSYGLDEFSKYVTDTNTDDMYYYDWQEPDAGDTWAEEGQHTQKTQWLEQVPAGEAGSVRTRYVEYMGNPTEARNHIDGQYPYAEPVWNPIAKSTLLHFSSSSTCTCGCTGHTHTVITDEVDHYNDPDDENEDGNLEPVYKTKQVPCPDGAGGECAVIQVKISVVEAYARALDALWEEIDTIYYPEYETATNDFNNASWAHIKKQVQFYNAVQDYYTASEFDMESMIRDAAYRDTSVFDETQFYTQAAYEYEFNAVIDGERVRYRDVFSDIGDGEEISEESNDFKPTVQELKLYYELWQNYAKYETNLPQSGKYINWWTPEVQLLYMVGGSYDAEHGRGIKIRDEYRVGGEHATCDICAAGIPEYDMSGQTYYNWMSTWAGDDYTGRDITTATKNFFYDIVSGGFDDGSLTQRTEYAYAYYYMFQYGTPYQQAVRYSNVGDEATKIMDEMISEGRWQTNVANTLSDAAMSHHDKYDEYQTAEITRQWEIDTSTAMSQSILATLGSQQSRSKANLLENIVNSCRYVNVIDNSTIGNAAIYLVDNPLIYAKAEDDPLHDYYVAKYGDGQTDVTEPVSSLYNVVYNIINNRLADKQKSPIGNEAAMKNGFEFVKTAVLWSGLDVEFENISTASELADYLKESSSSIWQNGESYQDSVDIGAANTRIWEQRKLGPYYDEDGGTYYRYKWYLVPRVLDGGSSSNTGLGWYDDLRSDDTADPAFGDVYDDLDDWMTHYVNEHDVNNMPTVEKGYDTNGYVRPLNENGQTADWVRVDWECWDKDCAICGGKGGHGDVTMLLPGDILIGPNNVVGMWLGAETVQSMYPLEAVSGDELVCVGGTDAQKLKSMADLGFEWSKPCSAYINHDVECPVHGRDDDLPTSPQKSDPNACAPYNPEGKWTVYRLTLPNYTDTYRSAGVTQSVEGEDWEIWYEYRYKGVSATADTKKYLYAIREELGLT